MTNSAPITPEEPNDQFGSHAWVTLKRVTDAQKQMEVWKFFMFPFKRTRRWSSGWLHTPSSVFGYIAQSVKNLPAVQEPWVPSLVWEDALEKEMATHSNILAWKISWTEEPGGLQSTGSQRVGQDWTTNTDRCSQINKYIYLKKKKKKNEEEENGHNRLVQVPLWSPGQSCSWNQISWLLIRCWFLLQWLPLVLSS